MEGILERGSGYRVAIVGLLVLSAFLLGTLVTLTGAQDAKAETAGHAPNLIAVTGEVGSNVSALYVIDAEKKQLAVYSAMGGRELRFIAARRIKYDLELREFNDRSEPRVSVARLADQFRRDTKADESEGGAKERK
ncbi:MAG: hypothetical protein L0216_15775 [Planctomycetales bacterium]|nr:hypothetical protein [Planctomycetales bacterium]